MQSLTPVEICTRCIICDESDPVVLEFDHRDGNDKIDSVSNLIRNSSWDRIAAELAKCDVLCANCHRRKSAAQFRYKRHLFIARSFTAAIDQWLERLIVVQEVEGSSLSCLSIFR